MAQIRMHPGETDARQAARQGRVAAALRVQDVPRPLLAALAVMLALAIAACTALWRTAGSQGTYVRASDEAAARTHGEAAAALVPTAASQREEEVANVEAAAHVTIDIDGAVAAPGVYELAEGARVKDAVTKAGGLAPDADTTTVNLAQKLADGQKVIIPRVGETPAAAARQVAAGDAQATGLVNINTADVAELDTLPGVGESTARAIVEDRERNGPFASPEDLMRVSGIGEKKFAKLQTSICV